MIVANHMLHGRDSYGLPEFREPSRAEMVGAQEAIVDSYIDGPDRWDLYTAIADTLQARVRESKVIPYEPLETFVYKIALSMASRWSVSDWASFRARGEA